MNVGLPSADIAQVSTKELAVEADTKFTRTRTEFFSNPPTEAGLTGVFQAGLKAVEVEAAASQMGKLGDKDGKTLEAWMQVYGKAIEAMDKGGHPELLKTATDQVAGMAVNDAEEKLRVARKETKLENYMTQVWANLEWALPAGKYGIFGDEADHVKHPLLERIEMGLGNAANWRDETLKAARSNLMEVQKNVDLTVGMVEKKTEQVKA
jgi:hypothetical protein